MLGTSGRTFFEAEYARWSPEKSAVSWAVSTITQSEPAVCPGVCTMRTSEATCHIPQRRDSM